MSLVAPTKSQILSPTLEYLLLLLLSPKQCCRSKKSLKAERIRDHLTQPYTFHSKVAESREVTGLIRLCKIQTRTQVSRYSVLLLVFPIKKN